MKYFHSASTGRSAGGLTRFLLLAGVAGVLGGSLASCRVEDPAPDLVQPTTAKPSYAPNENDQMWAVIEQFSAFNDPALPTLSARQARMTHSVTDAVNALLAKNDKTPTTPNLAISQRVLPAPSPNTYNSAPDGVPVRIYTPTSSNTTNLAADGTRPAIVYYHGGGWVIGSLNVYEPSAKALADRTGAIVFSVDYRLASETMNKFPAAHEDAYAAYKYVRDNATTLKVNPAKIAVAGESAGGNMAAAVCILARERGTTLPVHELLVYPVADNNLTTASYNQYASAVPLNRPNIQYFTGLYFNAATDGDSRLISLVDVADLRGLPPTTIIAAEIDPLQTEGATLRDRLTSAGVSVDYTLYTGTTHEFFGTYDVVPLANDAQNHAADRLKTAFQ
ncbi:alpha/beta hydrolase [Hymenobacter setariae]|uniref:Alpha/beta hydrolase n=1 Tax=Hymenobacter setariae TaxID=2594794 RepID=A0A558C2D6_9BACT|nr:alpha/beta hydrolase [Hymenobacter setariae]TVT42965.1 alpha/beta hydrolase [Hymenobacter setariae]